MTKWYSGWSVRCAALLIVAFSTSAWSQEPADNIIRNAQADLARYESQAAALTPGRTSNASRILKLMALSQERLAGSPNQTDPSWIQTNERYQALQAQLEGFINGGSTAASSSTTPAASAQATPAAPQSPAPGATPPASSSVPALVSGQRVQVKKLARDIANSRSSLVSTGPSKFQDANEVAARKKGLQQYQDAVARYPQIDDSDVAAARAELQAYQEALAAEFQRAQSQLQELGDVQAALAQLDQNSRSYPAPAPLALPFTREEATNWLSAASNARTVGEHNYAQLQKIAPLAYLPNNPGTPEGGAPYDANDVTRLSNNATGMLNAVQKNYDAMIGEARNRMSSMEYDLLRRWQEDPNDDSKRWLFLQPDQKTEAATLYSEARAIVNSRLYLEEAVGQDTSEARAMLARIDDAEAQFADKSRIALAGSRLPEPVSTDREMTRIATEVLENPRYEFGEHGKVILTTDRIVEREREDSEIEIDDAELTLGGDLKMSGTQTTWKYKWQEFKFAAPLKDTATNTWYIWWITAKKFSSGGPNTPIDRWVSGGATQGNPILEENL